MGIGSDSEIYSKTCDRTCAHRLLIFASSIRCDEANAAADGDAADDDSNPDDPDDPSGLERRALPVRPIKSSNRAKNNDAVEDADDDDDAASRAAATEVRTSEADTTFGKLLVVKSEEK